MDTTNNCLTSPFDCHYEYETSAKNDRTNNLITDRSGCSSSIHFGNTSYTLGFGHLFSGNLQYYQVFNPVRQCYELRSIEIPACCSNSLSEISHIDRHPLQQDSFRNHKVNEAMVTIRKTLSNVEKQWNKFIPSAPYRCNPGMNNDQQNNITNAAALLERAANAISSAAHTQNRLR